MEIRYTRPEELDIVMDIYDKARQVMRASGNMNQWINGYPSREMISDDIASHNSYVLAEGDVIHAVFTLIGGEDPTYKVIEGGEWLNDEPYMTIHRIASNGTLKHAADICYNWTLERTDNLRIDTHADNSIMRHVLDRNGFIECGVIYVSDGSPRIAYQKVK
ncbi:MAG: GNAT family N-acetyltransferase [Clostridiales bacterium]|nr:GNAT family N-acetyltransferase [Clostridiales bacterium]